MKWPLRVIHRLGLIGLVALLGLALVVLVRPEQAVRSPTAAPAQGPSGDALSAAPTTSSTARPSPGGSPTGRPATSAGPDGAAIASARDRHAAARSGRGNAAAGKATPLLTGGPGAQTLTGKQARKFAALAKQIAAPTTRHGGSRHGATRHGGSRHGGSRHGASRHGASRHGASRHGATRHGATVFTAASFNVLGAGHTAPGGDRGGWSSGVVRMRRAVALLQQGGVDLVGLQEFQAPQAAVFRARTGGSWQAFPGLALGQRLVQNSIAWRTDQWRLVEAHTVPVPYFYGRMFPMPYVLLRNSTTGQRLWVLNVHNPADAHGNAARFRSRAVLIEAALVNRLSASGLPVVLTGDFNDRAPALCGIGSRTGMRSADGGHASGGCVVPRGAGVDWIFMTPDVEAIGYSKVVGGVVGTVSDHPLVLATLKIPGG